MKTKQFISILIGVLFLFATQVKAQTVYITDTGKKYHAKNCDKAKTGKKGIDLATAKKQGYEPCKLCKSANTEVVADKPKDKKK